MNEEKIILAEGIVRNTDYDEEYYWNVFKIGRIIPIEKLQKILRKNDGKFIKIIVEVSNDK